MANLPLRKKAPESSDSFSRIFSTKAFDLNDEDGSQAFDEDEHYNDYYNLNGMGIGSNDSTNGINGVNNVKIPYLTQKSKHPFLNSSIFLSVAKPNDAIALVRVRTNCQPVPYECRNVPNPLYLSSLLSKVSAELKVSAENPTKNIIVKATDREKGLVVGYCYWGFAGMESRSLDDRPKMEIRSPEGYDRGWLEKYVAAFGDLESTTVPKGDCILLMHIAVMSDYQRRGIGTLLLQWGLRRADADVRLVHTIASPDREGLYAKLGFQCTERRILQSERPTESDGSDARTLCAMIRLPVSAKEWQARKERREEAMAAAAAAEMARKRRTMREERRDESRASLEIGETQAAPATPDNTLKRTRNVRTVRGGRA